MIVWQATREDSRLRLFDEPAFEPYITERNALDRVVTDALASQRTSRLSFLPAVAASGLTSSVALRLPGGGWEGIMGPATSIVTVFELVIGATRWARATVGVVGSARAAGREGTGDALAVARGGGGAMVNNG